MRPSTVPYSAVAVLFLDILDPAFEARFPAYFARIDHKPAFVHALDALAASKRFREIVLYVHPNWIRYAVEEVEYWNIQMVHHIYPASSEKRLENVKVVLSTIPEAYDCICLHSGIYPLTDSKGIAEVVDRAFKSGCASLFSQNESLSSASNNKLAHKSNEQSEDFHYPVAFQLKSLKKIMDSGSAASLNDLGSLCTANYPERELVKSEEPNPGIKTTGDLERCESLIRKRVEKRL